MPSHWHKKIDCYQDKMVTMSTLRTLSERHPYFKLEILTSWKLSLFNEPICNGVLVIDGKIKHSRTSFIRMRWIKSSISMPVGVVLLCPWVSHAHCLQKPSGKKCQHWWASCRVLYKWYFFSEHWRKINRHLWFRFSLSKLKSYYKAHPKTMKEYFLPLTRLAFATVFVLAFIVWPSPWLPYEFILIRLYHLHANYNTSFNTYHYRVSTGCTAQAPDIPCCLWDLVTLTWLISWKWKKIRKN